MIQVPFCSGYHDSLQYHIFCGDRVFATRVFWTASLWHHSAWVYDGSVRELLNSSEPLTQSGEDYADLSGPSYRLSAPDSAVSIRVESGATDAELEIHLEPRQLFDGPSMIGPGLHQPNMRAEVRYAGERLEGTAYCKRYDFRGDPVRYWGYRFVQGPIEDHSITLWTADATFGYAKHAYFRFIDSKGVVHAAALKDSCHRDNNAYGLIDGVEYDVAIEELGVWETQLRSARMDSQMRQRVCRMTVHHDGQSQAGYAINETCFGTLG